MKLMVNPVITDFQQDVNGDIKMLKLGEGKEDAYANIIAQGSADLENNKAATINVSTYTEPVGITPTSGKDGMKKATITLSNIPAPIDGVYGVKVRGYNAGVLVITNGQTVGDIMEYNGEESTFDEAVADTSHWVEANSTVSTSIEGASVEGAEYSHTFVTITIDGDLYDLSDLGLSLDELTPYEPEEP